MDNQKLDTHQAIQYGWLSVKKDFWYFVGIAFVVMVLSGIGSSDPNETSSYDLIGFLFSILMTCGYLVMFLSYYGGKKMPFGKLFAQSKFYFRVLGATLLVGLVIGVGFVFLIVPGMYLALKYQFTNHLIVDRNLGILEAMKESARLTNGKKIDLLVFDLKCLAVVILGVLALGVGIFVAIPVVELATIKVYRGLMPAGAA